MQQDPFAKYKVIEEPKPDPFAKYKTVTEESLVKSKEEEEAEKFVAELTAKAQAATPPEKSFMDKAWDFGKTVMATAYGEEGSALPAVKGITRPLLPSTAGKDANGWEDMQWLYENVVRPQTSVVGAASDWLGGKVIGGVVKGIRGLRNYARGAAREVSDILPNAANPQVAKVGGAEVKVIDSTVDKPLTPPVNVKPEFGKSKIAVDTAPVGTRAYSKKPPTPEQIKEAKNRGYDFVGEIDDHGRYVFTKVSDTPLPTPLLESEIAQARPTKINAEGRVGPLADVKKPSKIAEAINLPRAIMASNDLSAPLRQGLGLIHKKAFWQALPDMFKAYGSEDMFRAMQDEIASRPLFSKRLGEIDELTGKPKILPSFADDAGLKLTDLTDLSHREEALMSTWAEKVPGVRRSNRAYTIFLNKLRADTFDDLIKTGQVFGADAKANLPLAREIANFVNTATGRGSLGPLERSAVTLNSMFFSPRLIASRLQMLNPHYYITANPMVRKEALKSLMAIAGAGNIVTGLGRFAGGTVESDPASSDFGKLKIGDTRIDPFGGFQQYIVLANRLSPQSINIAGKEIPVNPLGGRMKSSTTGKEYNFGDMKFGRSNRLDVLARFSEQKLNPLMSFATGMLKGKNFKGEPFNVTDETAQRFIPIIIQDMIELSTENPELLPGVAQLFKGEDLKPQNLPLAIPSMFGMSVQKYSDRRK